MEKAIFDTSTLISHWNQCKSKTRGTTITLAHARVWGQNLIALRRINAIVTPVVIEFVAGITHKSEMEMARAFLDQFQNIDNGSILAEDWREARRIAERIPRDSKPRHLGDCLVRAIANRLRHDVDTLDNSFPP
jgi:hypothetical protein